MMLMNTAMTDSAAVAPAVPPRDFLSTLVWIKGDGPSTAGTQSVIEILAPQGWATPWHNHHTHDEYFYILEGEVTAQVGEARIVLRPGDYAFGPRGVPHGYRVTGDGPARLLMMTGDRDFAEFVRDVSTPAESDTLPPPADHDFGRLTEVAARHGIEVYGPLHF
jgi:quercetin dioxygenase-like cupin family protein